PPGGVRAGRRRAPAPPPAGRERGGPATPPPAGAPRPRVRSRGPPPPPANDAGDDDTLLPVPLYTTLIRCHSRNLPAGPRAAERGRSASLQREWKRDRLYRQPRRGAERRPG